MICMSVRRVFSIVLSVCFALFVQGVAQARVMALGCGSMPMSHAPAQHAMPTVTPDHIGVHAAINHDCCDDADAPPAQPQPCNMGGQCHAVSLSPLPSVPPGVEPAPVTIASIVLAAPALACGAPDRVWRPPTLA
jgi:hypothetical protein